MSNEVNENPSSFMNSVLEVHSSFGFGHPKTGKPLRCRNIPAALVQLTTVQLYNINVKKVRSCETVGFLKIEFI